MQRMLRLILYGKLHSLWSPAKLLRCMAIWDLPRTLLGLQEKELEQWTI